MEEINIYGYMRVSSKEQNEDRQKIALTEMGVPCSIFCGKQRVKVMCDIHAVGKMAGKLSAERDTFMKEKEEYLESIQSKLRKLLFEEIALEDARKMYN